MSIRDAILKQTEQSLPCEPVTFAGQNVYVRTMTGAERDGFETAYLESKARSKPNIRGTMAAFTLCDENGQRLFNDEDAEALSKLPAAELDRVFSLGQKLNKITEADVEELEGNSEATSADGSTSA